MQVLTMEGEERLRINYYILKFLMASWYFKVQKGGGWNLKNLASLKVFKKTFIALATKVGLGYVNFIVLMSSSSSSTMRGIFEKLFEL
jgi:hypothetical protein